MKKRQKSQCQTEFKIVNSHSTPFTKEEFEACQIQNLYVCFDANLPFHYTNAYHVKKLFLLMKSSIAMPKRKYVSGRILKAENKRVFDEPISKMKANSECFGGVTIAWDAWKNIKK